MRKLLALSMKRKVFGLCVDELKEVGESSSVNVPTLINGAAVVHFKALN
jgi:hypothetical protein